MNKSLKTILIAGAILLVLVGGVYFLFFAPTPGIEVLVPSEQKVTAQLSAIQLNTQPAVEAFTSGKFKRYAAPVSTGQVGRLNPFVRF